MPGAVKPATKTCGRCGLPKPAGHFNTRKDTRDGLQTNCRPCQADVWREGRERRRKEAAAETLRARAAVPEAEPCEACGTYRGPYSASGTYYPRYDTSDGLLCGQCYDKLNQDEATRRLERRRDAMHRLSLYLSRDRARGWAMGGPPPRPWPAQPAEVSRVVRERWPLRERGDLAAIVTLSGWKIYDRYECAAGLTAAGEAS